MGYSSDPRLDHREWDQTVLSAYSDVFSDESMGIQSLAFAMTRTKPEQAKTAIASQGSDIGKNLDDIANAIRIKGIIDNLRQQDYTQERIALETSRYLSTQGLEPNDNIDDTVSPWYNRAST